MKQYPPYEADNPPGAPLISRRRQVKGTKPRVKRWTLEELQKQWDGFWLERDLDDPKWDTDSHINIAFAKFFDWLEEQR